MLLLLRRKPREDLALLASHAYVSGFEFGPGTVTLGRASGDDDDGAWADSSHRLCGWAWYAAIGPLLDEHLPR